MILGVTSLCRSRSPVLGDLARVRVRVRARARVRVRVRGRGTGKGRVTGRARG